MLHAKVKYRNKDGLSKEYDYKTNLEGLKEGDIVVVEARDWYSVAVFSRYVLFEEKPFELKSIVDKVRL